LVLWEDGTGKLEVGEITLYNAMVEWQCPDPSVIEIVFDDAEGDEIVMELEVRSEQLVGEWHYSDSSFSASGTIDVRRLP
jgi:hypothetical protein